MFDFHPVSRSGEFSEEKKVEGGGGNFRQPLPLTEDFHPPGEIETSNQKQLGHRSPQVKKLTKRISKNFLSMSALGSVI